MGKPLVVAIFLLFAAAIALYSLGRTPGAFNVSSFSTSTSRIYSPSSPSTLVPYQPYTYGGSTSSGPGNIFEAAYLSQIPDSQIPRGFTRADLSPYFAKIKISSAYAYSFSHGEIRLYSYYNNKDGINISGWRVKTNHGEVIITQAINSYEPSGFSVPGDIILKSNNYFSIYSGISPLSRNFRLNKCTGYLNNLYQFQPALSSSCPLPEQSGIQYLSGQCQTYVRSLGGCQLPDSNFYNRLPGNAEGNACRNFLNGISYRSCYDEHRSDADFLSNEWRYWSNQNILDPQHDLVRLYDKQGLLVDEYRY